MNPETKLILDELHKRFTDHDLKWDQRFAEQDTRFGRQIQELEQAQDARVFALEKLATSFDEWRPGIQGTVNALRLDGNALASTARATHPVCSRCSPTEVSRPSANLTTTTLVVGHRVDPQYRESGFGVVSTLIHSPVKGEHPIPPSPPPPVTTVKPFHVHDSSSNSDTLGVQGHSNSKIPKVDFPKFDGDQPKLWLSDCLDYFNSYNVESSSWVRIARLHFVATAKHWYNAAESQIQGCSWDTFSAMVMARFRKDHHELLLCQLFQIRQTGPVVKYVEKFSAIVDQLGAYHRTTDPLFFTMRFIDGLQDHIRALVSLHCPPN
jgi:hypothetical protein